MSSFVWGAQSVVNSMLTVAGTGLPAFYRVANAVDTQQGTVDDEARQFGFVETDTVATQADGFVDIPIWPQPRVRNVSMRDIANSGGKLNETSRYFVLSADFVRQIATKYGLNDPELVFDGFAQFMGIFYCGALYNVQQYAHSEVGGETVSWRLTCNAIKTM